MTGDKFQKLRIFVASPGDVMSERARLVTVLDDLKGLANHIGVTLELSEWGQVVSGMGRPEQVILDQLNPETWDVFIGILWHRFGTPTGARQVNNEKEYLSGTEEEFLIAYDLWKKYKRPHVMFYRCFRPIPPESLDVEQYTHVKDFFAEFSANSDHPGLYCAYHNSDEFERILRQNLIDFLVRYLGQEKKRMISPQEVEVFAPQIPNNLPRRVMFFGRNNEMERVMSALSPNERGWGVVIDGIGGIGKTALAIEATYRIKEQNIFEAFIFVSAKQNRLDPLGIKSETSVATTLDDFVNETARIFGKTSITQLTGDEKRHALLNVLRTVPTLLLFDNLETLTSQEQESLADWLRFLPQGCKAILTSRRRGGEGSLWLRLEKLDWVASRSIIEYEAKKDARLEAVLQQVGETRWNELYEETGGSPLALKWALGLIRARDFSFDHALEVLKQGSSRESDLQKFIFDEALNGLSDNDMAVLNALSFFVPFATFQALMTVTNLSRAALASALERLSVLSLVNVDLKNNEQYSIHPLTRRFTRLDLVKNYDTENIIGINFARYWTDFAKQHGGWDKDSYKSFDKLETDWGNLYETTSWLWEKINNLDNWTGKSDAAKMLVDVASYLSFFLSFSGRWDEYIQLNENAYEASLTLNDWRRTGWRAFDIAWMSYKRAQTSNALIWINKCSEAWALEGTKGDKATEYKLRGLLAQQVKDYGKAEEYLQESLKIRRSLGAHREVAFVLNSLGQLSQEQKKYDDAHRSFSEALELSRSFYDRALQSSLSNYLGMLALDTKRWHEAQDWFEQVLLLGPEVGRLEIIGKAKYGLACMHQAKEQINMALPLALDALKIFESLQHRKLSEVRELVRRLQNSAQG